MVFVLKVQYIYRKWAQMFCRIYLGLGFFSIYVFSKVLEYCFQITNTINHKKQITNALSDTLKHPFTCNLE